MTEFRGMPKILPYRSEAYREWLRERRCVWCARSPSVAHHEDLGQKAMGAKVSDLHCIPLCVSQHGIEGCHDKRHRIGVSYFEGWDIARVCLSYINQYLSEGNKLI
jgi:hypothetical protein